MFFMTMLRLKLAIGNEPERNGYGSINNRVVCQVDTGSTVLLGSGELDKTMDSSGKRGSQFRGCLHKIMMGLKSII